MNDIASRASEPSSIEGVERAIEQLNQIILGKDRAVRLSLCCLLAGGHLLIEDIPGVGKTTLAHAIARSLGLSYQRIQFTSDLLPADILGASVFDRERGDLTFRPGPIFAQTVLADEVNRATPKTQSALLEAMEEHQVTTETTTRPLPEPFFVIATQNPQQQVGTFPLPESQLDRFLMRLSLGYPDPAAERQLLLGQDRRELLTELEPVLRADDLSALKTHARNVHLSEPLMNYLQALVIATRESPMLESGLSPRGGLALRQAAQAWALMHRRKGVEPEDVQTVFPAVAGHRLVPLPEYRGRLNEVVETLLRDTPVA
ncbi:AAA family ATPase [Natronospira bacteriovora]|uniref:MoxR family ATPase n=1 Tax=Natronospira bacteriovora TaxID=3069753 RepID=A0ABU0W5Y6_9GAMM|nr:MoxR family ATPase [Natronospira sp. AB-CW4]MDQ2069429.1 MoxR family ATPase [Natronospira sp. AB-CW4]